MLYHIEKKTVERKSELYVEAFNVYNTLLAQKALQALLQLTGNRVTSIRRHVVATSNLILSTLLK